MRGADVLARLDQIQTRDHDLLAGLADDDHTQYTLRSILTANGDIFIRSGGVIARLAVGGAGQVVGVVAGLPAWTTLTVVGATSGSYTGNDSANRAIPHGLGVAPKIIFIWCDTTGQLSAYRIMNGLAKVLYISGGSAAFNNLAVTAPNATNFYVGNATAYNTSANFSTWSYYWVAIG